MQHIIGLVLWQQKMGSAIFGFYCSCFAFFLRAVCLPSSVSSWSVGGDHETSDLTFIAPSSHLLSLQARNVLSNFSLYIYPFSTMAEPDDDLVDYDEEEVR